MHDEPELYRYVPPETPEEMRFGIEVSSDLPAGGMRAVLIAGRAESAAAQRLMVTARAGKRTHVLYDSGFFQQECGTPGYSAGTAFYGETGKGRYAAFEVIRDAYTCCGGDGLDAVEVYFVDPRDYSLITVAERSFKITPETQCTSKPSPRIERESVLRLEGDFLHIRTLRSRDGVKLPPEETSLRVRHLPRKAGKGAD